MKNRVYHQQGRWLQFCLLGLLTWSLFVVLAPKRSWAQAVAAGVIEGRVWKDANSDGIYQLEEPFLSSTLVELYWLDPTQAPEPPISTAPLLTTTTTVTGSYAFHGLAPGSYVVKFMTRGNMYPTMPKQGADETKDSDVFSTGMVTHARSAVLRMATPGQQWIIDAGFVLAAQATIYVYDDTNRDTNRQIEEPVVLGAVVILHDNTGHEVKRQVVDQRGAVLFADLPPGEYAVTVWPPEGYSDDPRAAVALSLAPGANMRLSAPVAAAPKVIDLTAFTVVVEKSELVIRWVTAVEQQTYGYRLFRNSGITAAAAEQLTPDMIASKGIQGGSYEVRLPYRPAYDGPATAMEFWLIEYEITGKENHYGPFYVTLPLLQKAFLPLVTTLP